MLPLQITMKDIPASPALENQIRERTEKLSQFYDRIISCRVVIEVPQKHKHRGKLFKACIDLSVPGKELVVNRKFNEDAHIAVRDAFDAMERQLEDHARKRHGRVKIPNGIQHGYVTKLMPEEGYGFIEDSNGNQYYFSMNNVSYPTFDKLMIGDAVEYMSEYLSEGQHAHHVVLERHHQQAFQ